MFKWVQWFKRLVEIYFWRTILSNIIHASNPYSNLLCHSFHDKLLKLKNDIGTEIKLCIYLHLFRQHVLARYISGTVVMSREFGVSKKRYSHLEGLPVSLVCTALYRSPMAPVTWAVISSPAHWESVSMMLPQGGHWETFLPPMYLRPGKTTFNIDFLLGWRMAFFRGRGRLLLWIKACCLSQGKEGELLSLSWEGTLSQGEYREAFAVLSHVCALPSGFIAHFPSAKISIE